MVRTAELQPLRAAILRDHPELAPATFTVVTRGWDSIAVDVDDRLIFKFPRDEEAERALRREAALLEIVGPAITMAVPRMTIHPGPPLFSRHEKLKGGYLLADAYAALPAAARHGVAEELGRFYAELHRLHPAVMRAAGALPLEPWRESEAIRARAIPGLPRELRGWAEEMLAAYTALPPDPHGTTYGFFDGHGWNMAFDHETGRLNGIYDFADSGIGPVHQEFIYSNFIAPELTSGIIASYEAITGRPIDRGRVDVLTAVHRLAEVAELGDDPEHGAATVRYAVEWASRAAGR